MSSIAERVQLPHPAWCTTDLDGGAWRSHSAYVGDDIELPGGVQLYLQLFQVDGRPAEILLGHHTAEETSNVSLDRARAIQLRDLLDEALGLLAREAGL